MRLDNTMAQMEVKKMKQGMSYSCKEKIIILNVFKYFRLQFPEKCVTEIVRRTSKATGCSEKSIFQFRKEESSAEGFKIPSTTKIRRNININSRDIKYDHSVRQAIRNIVYDLKYKNIIPSLNAILKQVNADAQIPKFSLMTLRRLLFDMGFSYEKTGNKSILVEKPLQASIKNSKEVKKEKLKKNKKPHLESCSPNLTNNIPSNIEVTHQLPQSSVGMSSLTQAHPMNTQQNHRLLPMHLHQHDTNTHIMPSMPHLPHHNMPMMFNRMPPTHPPMPTTNMNMPHWMHHPPPALMKQE